MNDYHIPVLLTEVIELLKVKTGGKYIDCTLGGSGHTKAILSLGGKVLGIDQDCQALENAPKNENLVLRQGNFAHLNDIAQEAGFDQVDGILMDLGVSSHQLETDYRGFSFNKEAALDMRMDPQNQTVTAADLVNAGSEKELANLFWKFGEERASRAIAKAIVAARPITTTNQLAQIALKIRRRSSKDRTHPATRIFQALRIAVNNELESLELALPQAVELLKPKGVLVVISFHSLEDRIVKKFMKQSQLITPSEAEIENNPRARSGKLRVYEKTAKGN